MTAKQQVAISKLIENFKRPDGNKITVGQAMKEAGYPPSMVKNPQRLTQSKAWKELMQDHLPDEKLAKVHEEGLEATRASNAAILVAKDGSVVKAEEQGLIEVPDYAVRHKYLETAYKLKGRMGPDTQVNQQFNVEDMKVEFT